jgi:hypothetical protein
MPRNRVGLPASVDGRSVMARRFRDLVADFAGELGGSDDLTPSQASLVRQCAALTVEAERLQSALLSGEAVGSEIVRVANALTRLLSALGVQRWKKQPEHVPAWLQGDVDAEEES